MRTIRNGIVAAMFAFATLSTQTASAVGVTSQKIQRLAVFGTSTQSMVVITFPNVATTPPSCAVQTSSFILDASTARGKLQLNMLTAAFLGGKLVTITGTGTCTSITNFPFQTETVAFVTME